MTTKKKAAKKDGLKKAENTIINASVAKEYIAIEYESLRDDAMEMARVLREIDRELHIAAMSDLKEDCGYSPKTLLANLCKIMYSCYVNIDHEMFK